MERQRLKVLGGDSGEGQPPICIDSAVFLISTSISTKPLLTRFEEREGPVDISTRNQQDYTHTST